MYVLFYFRKMAGKKLLEAWTRNFCNCPIIWAAKSSLWAMPLLLRTLPCTTSWNGTMLLTDISCQNVSWIQEFSPFLKWFHQSASFSDGNIMEYIDRFECLPKIQSFLKSSKHFKAFFPPFAKWGNGIDNPITFQVKHVECNPCKSES